MALEFLSGWTKCRTFSHFGVDHTVGYSGGKWYAVAIFQGTDEIYLRPDGTEYSEIATGVERETGLWGDSSGVLYVDLPLSDRNRRYVSRDIGYSWDPVDP